MHRLLFTLLMLLTAAGPGLCCCTLPRLVSPASEVPSCCHSPADEQPEPCKKECPCRTHRGKSALVAKVMPVDLVTTPTDFVAWDVAFGAPGVRGSIDTTGLPLPFLSAKRLLHVHHRLRC